MYKMKTLASRENNINFKEIPNSDLYSSEEIYNILITDSLPSAWIEIKEVASQYSNINVTFSLEKKLNEKRITFIPLGNKILNELAAIEKFLNGVTTDLSNVIAIITSDEQISSLANTNCKYVREEALNFHEVSFIEPEDFDVYQTLQRLKYGKDVDCNNKRGNYLIPPSFLLSKGIDYQSTINFFNSLDQQFLIEGDSDFEEFEVLFEDVESPIPDSWESFLDENVKLDLSEKEAMKLAYLCRLAGLGFVKRFGKKNPAALKRLKFELNVIAKKNFFNYFLIVWDLVRFAKSHKIAVGKGRGSVCGSILAYCLYITDINPLQYNLKFERFLSLYRKNKPDIDLDFPENKVHLVWRYFAEKYGDYAHIITFNSYGVTGALAAVKNLYKISDDLSALVTKGWEGTLEEFLETKEGLKLKIALKDKNLLEQVETIDKLALLPQSLSTHPSGIVIANNLSNNVPIINLDGMRTVPFTKTDDQIEKIGLIKFDILRIRTLNIIQSIREMIGFNDFSLDLLSDEKTLETYANGNTTGVFQFKSRGITETCEKVKPSKFTEIVDILAIYRPGPMSEIEKYVHNKFSEAKNIFGIGEEALKLEAIFPVIAPSNYVILYQEQVMEIAQIWADYDLSQADNFRRAISGKNESLLLSERERFISAASKIGRAEEHSNLLYELILKFAKYGYNKNHSVGYSAMSFETAYYKTHYPLQFYVASLNSALNSPKKKEKVTILMKDAIQNGFKFKIPSTEVFYDSFFIENEEIVVPFTTIPGIGSNLMERIRYNPELLNNNSSLKLLSEYPSANQLRKLSIEIELFGFNLDSNVFVIENIRTIIDKRNREMAFVDFYNRTKSFVVFADIWEKYKHLKPGNLVYPVITGNKISNFKQNI